jgi:hypothetical protein
LFELHEIDDEARRENSSVRSSLDSLGSVGDPDALRAGEL